MNPPRFALNVTPLALSDIADQAAYYEDAAGDHLSESWQSAVNEALRSLRQLPERGFPVPTRRNELAGLRSLHIEGFPKHLIFYLVDTEELVIHILLVAHGARDLTTLLNARSV